MSSKKIILRTLHLGLATVIFALIIFNLGKLITYFKTGAEKVNKYELGLKILPDHKPDLKWLTDDNNIMGDINPYIRKEIGQSYIDAWGILNLSLQHQLDLGLKENFTDIKIEQINKSFISKDSIIRKDLKHQLKLHFLSYDKQVVSFTDKNMVSSYENLFISKSNPYLDTSSYKVVMTLHDGKWLIDKLHRF